MHQGPRDGRHGNLVEQRTALGIEAHPRTAGPPLEIAALGLFDLFGGSRPSELLRRPGQLVLVEDAQVEIEADELLILGALCPAAAGDEPPPYGTRSTQASL